MIRTALIPPEGKKYIVADFSAIEARVIAWLAGEQWRIDVFANGEDIYCTSASRIFGVKVEKNGEHAELKQKGKVAELACAYGGSVGAMKNMGGSDLKLTDMDTYGAKLVENIVQGIARDILLYAMQNLSDYRIVAHVHDEIIIEAEKNASVESICKIMSQTPEWAEGLLLRADGYECNFYMKS